MGQRRTPPFLTLTIFAGALALGGTLSPSAPAFAGGLVDRFVTAGGTLVAAQPDFEIGLRELLVPTSPDGCSVDLTTTPLAGLGFLWGREPEIQYFAGAGMAAPVQPLEGDAGRAALDAWVGTGVRLTPARPLRLALETRWAPADFGTTATTFSPLNFETALSLSLCW